jgi:hypothetical protein
MIWLREAGFDRFPVEFIPTREYRRVGDVVVALTTVAHARLIKLYPIVAGIPIDTLEACTIGIVEYLQANNIPHNLIFCPNGHTFIYPRKWQTPINMPDGKPGINVGAMEAAGFILFQSKEMFDYIQTYDQVKQLFEDHVNFTKEKLLHIINSF